MGRPEKIVEDKVEHYLMLKGYVVTKVDAGSPYLGAQGIRLRSKTKPGTSDILACSPGGRFWAIEVKTPKTRKNVSDLQQEFLIKVIKSGGIGCVVSSVEELQAVERLVFVSDPLLLPGSLLKGMRDGYSQDQGPKDQADKTGDKRLGKCRLVRAKTNKQPGSDNQIAQE